MHKIILKSFAILLSVFSVNAHAQDWRVDVGLGVGEIDVDDATLFDGQISESDAGFSGELGLGYRFLDRGYARLSYVGVASVSPVLLVADSFNYSSIRTGVGYEWESDSPFVFGAEVGASFWEVDGSGSILFNLGSQQSGSLDGTDFYVKGSVGYKFTDSFTLGASADYENSDFGGVTGLRLFAQFNF